MRECQIQYGQCNNFRIMKLYWYYGNFKIQIAVFPKVKVTDRSLITQSLCMIYFIQFTIKSIVVFAGKIIRETSVITVSNQNIEVYITSST